MFPEVKIFWRAVWLPRETQRTRCVGQSERKRGDKRPLVWDRTENDDEDIIAGGLAKRTHRLCSGYSCVRTIVNRRLVFEAIHDFPSEGL